MGDRGLTRGLWVVGLGDGGGRVTGDRHDGTNNDADETGWLDRRPGWLWENWCWRWDMSPGSGDPA